jgi:rhamnopyranosyl-N-acetylglucosaminyl-diphospho-decaprenol beta-1,3/1,4-galactofuranosyltransferase
MRVLAHIHTFNDADIIDRTIEAVLLQTRPVDGILVVDNASTDGTGEWLAAQPAPVRALRLPDNRGGAGGSLEDAGMPGQRRTDQQLRPLQPLIP